MSETAFKKYAKYAKSMYAYVLFTIRTVKDQNETGKDVNEEAKDRDQIGGHPEWKFLNQPTPIWLQIRIQ
jgi:hypothetical protein